eukprot:11021966-Alexandrium_andersonii.AAC.1
MCIRDRFFAWLVEHLAHWAEQRDFPDSLDMPRSCLTPTGPERRHDVLLSCEPGTEGAPTGRAL